MNEEAHADGSLSAIGRAGKAGRAGKTGGMAVTSSPPPISPNAALELEGVPGRRCFFWRPAPSFHQITTEIEVARSRNPTQPGDPMSQPSISQPAPSPSTKHATFVVERAYLASPARVFAAWATAEAKDRWFCGPADRWTLRSRELDFRVGGRELLVGAFTTGTVSTFEARYQDIVPNQRIVYSYDMHIDDNRISVSLATVEFQPVGAGTKVVVTEQGVFLDGRDNPAAREAGTRALLENLDAALLREAM